MGAQREWLRAACLVPICSLQASACHVPLLTACAAAARGLALLLGPLVCPLPLLPHLALAAFAVEVGAGVGVCLYACASKLVPVRV
jgi:hypothetical protein